MGYGANHLETFYITPIQDLEDSDIHVVRLEKDLQISSEYEVSSFEETDELIEYIESLKGKE